MSSSTTATQHETVLAILAESQRPGKLPLRLTFCQQGRGKTTKPGPLARFVRRGRDSALNQFLLARAWASSEPYDVRRDSRIWARADGLASDESGRAAVSRNWKFMKEMDLVRVERAGRLARVTLLREDGSGQPYTHPAATKSRYFTLPYEYWTSGLYTELQLPGKALLLIALSLPDDFSLPAERGPDWYGISPSTVERGIRELRKAEVLRVRRVRKSAPLAPEGYTMVNLYSLARPYGTEKSSLFEGDS